MAAAEAAESPYQSASERRDALVTVLGIVVDSVVALHPQLALSDVNPLAEPSDGGGARDGDPISREPNDSLHHELVRHER